MSARGYDPQAVQARVEELTSARAALEARAQGLERELRALSEAAAAGPTPLRDRFLDDLHATLRAAYADADLATRAEQDRAQAECAAARAVVAARLAELDEESRRAQDEALDAARQVLAEATREADRIRSEGGEAAAGIMLGASTLVESSRVQAAERTSEFIAELANGQRAAEQVLEAAQQEAEARLAAAERDLACATEQAASTAAVAGEEATRIVEEARREAADIRAENDRVVAGLRQASERIAAVLDTNLRNATRFADGLHLAVDEPGDLATRTADDPDDDTRPGLLAEVVSLLPRRRAR